MLSKRISADNIGSNGPAYMSVWLFFQIAAGHIALPVLIVTMLFAKSLKKSRRVQLVNVFVTWVVSAVCYTLLFYVGEHTGPEPNKNLCIAQASLIGAVPMMTSTAVLIFAYHLLRTYDDPDALIGFESRQKRVSTFWQLITPYLVFAVFVAIIVNIALKHPDRVNREQRYFYCSLRWDALTDAVAIIATVMCVAAVALYVHIAVTAARYWRLLRRGDHLTNESVILCARAFAFTCFLLASTVLNLADIWAQLGVVPDLFSASVGMALFLIFVSQKDVALAWCFWRHLGASGTKLSSNRAVPYSPNEPDVPILRASAGDTLDGDRSSKNTWSSSMLLKDYYESKAHGVEIIGRPDEAFTPPNFAGHDRAQRMRV